MPNSEVGPEFGPSELALARALNRLLRERHVTVAEGTTGGRISKRLVRYPGATAYFRAPSTPTNMPSRTTLLGIPQSLLLEHGSVSETAVRAMAEAVRERFAAAAGLASSGSTGPSGTNVGRVWIAAATAAGTDAREHLLERGSRLVLQERFTALALALLRDTVDVM